MHKYLSPSRAAVGTVVGAVVLSSCSPRPGSLGESAGTEARGSASSGGAGLAAALAPARRGEWSTIAPGVEMRRLRWDDRGQKVAVVALRVAPSRLVVAVAPRGQSLEAPAWRVREKALAAFNGGFFDAEDRPLGVRLSSRRLVSAAHGTRWSVFRVKRVGQNQQAGIVSAGEFADARKRGVRYEQAVQCGPRLVSGGRLGSFKEQWGRRTGLGIDAGGRVIVAASDGDLSLLGWAQCFARGLKCPNALNLDGGSSTQLSLRAGSASIEWAGRRGVPDAILIR